MAERGAGGGLLQRAVLLVEDHELMADGLRARLEGGGLTVCDVVDTERGAVDAYRFHTPDLVLCDVGLKDTTGIKVTAALLQAFPAARVLMYSAYFEPDTIESAMAAGALGYVRKTATVGELLELVEEALAPEAAAPLHDRDTLQAMVRAANRRYERAATAAEGPVLTRRERELLEVLASGLTTNDEMAKELGVSAATVSSHVNRLLFKFGVGTRAAVVAKAYRDGLLTTRSPGQLPTRPPT